MENSKHIRIAHLVSHPIQYMAPLYRELASRDEIDLTVFFYSDQSLRTYSDPGFGQSIQWDVPLLDGYKYRFLPSSKKRDISDNRLVWPNWDLLRAVRNEGFDAVWVHGHAHPNAWVAASGRLVSPERVLFRQEQALLDSVPWPKRWLKELVVRFLFRKAIGLYIGENNRRYYQHYGVPDARLFPSPYSVDNAFFQNRHQELAPRRWEIRQEFGIGTDDPVILFVGKFVDKKQPLLALEAFRKLRERRKCWLLMVGSGPLEEEVVTYVKRHAIPDVVMPGFMNQTELPRAYTAADLFVLPSAYQETWGLVVNEAMNFGLPVVVSDRVGCAPDLVREDWNGFVVPHGDPAILATGLEDLVKDPEKLARFGENSKHLVEDYSIPRTADGIVEACLAATGKQTP